MQPFKNKEKEFLGWIRRHSDNGFLLNCVNGASDSPGWPYMLHRANCVKFTAPNRRSGKNFTTHRYFKVCSTDRAELELWAKSVLKEPVRKCRLCL